jgi:hypothetical protein
MIMRIRILTTAATLLPVCLLTACVPMTPNLDSHFGEAVNMAKAQQTINPDASRNPDPVSGMDGQAGMSAMENYHQSFKTPAPTTTQTTQITDLSSD